MYHINNVYQKIDKIWIYLPFLPLIPFLLLYPEAQFIPNKQLQPKETQIYIKLVKYAMQALDIYQV